MNIEDYKKQTLEVIQMYDDGLITELELVYKQYDLTIGMFRILTEQETKDGK